MPVVSVTPSLDDADTKVTSPSTAIGEDSFLADGERYFAEPLPWSPTSSTQTDACCQVLTGLHFPRHTIRDKDGEVERSLRVFDRPDDDKVRRRWDRQCIAVERPGESAALGNAGA